MSKLLLALLAAVGVAGATCAQQKQNMNNEQPKEKILVAYFSATGTTARAAEKLADVTGGELYAITPAKPYTSADLDWHDGRSRSSVEMNDPKARPALKDKKENIDDYDVIFIGSPCWWATVAPPVATFLASYDLAGKTVVPFMTHEGSRMGHSEADIRKLCPQSTVPDGLPVRGGAVGSSKDAVEKWVRARLKSGL